MDAKLREVPAAGRRLLRTPTFTIVALLILGAGMGIVISVYTVVDRVLVRPLPFNAPDRLVVIWETNPELGIERDRASAPNFLDWQRGTQLVEQMGAFQYDTVTVAGGTEPLLLRAARMTPCTLQLLEVPAAQGRIFNESEGDRCCHRVTVLSHALWQRAFGGDPNVLGEKIVLDGWPHEVVGVMPEGFRFPDEDTELWVPLVLGDESPRARARRSLNVIGRLRPTALIETAQAELATVANRLSQEYPETNSGWGVTMVSARDQLVEDVRPALTALMVAVILVLLIACANLASLLLVRNSGRAHEFAIRTALGAEKGQIAYQVLVESLLLSLVGGWIAVLLAKILVPLLVSAAGDHLPFAYRIQLDGRAFLFGFGLSLVIGLLLGLVPALRSMRQGMGELRVSTASSGKGSSRVQASLVAGEIALALVLTVAAGLLIQSFSNLSEIDPGFNPSELVTARINLPQAQYPEDHDQLAFFAQLFSRLEARPEVRRVGAVTALPLSPAGIDFDLPVQLDAASPRLSSEAPQADYRVASPGYFNAMGIQLLRGRGLSERDREDSLRVMVINETMARQFWGTESPIGERVSIPFGGSHEVVGVVGDVLHRGLSQEPRPEMYVPLAQSPFGSLTLVLRTDKDPSTLTEVIRQEVAAIDPAQPISELQTMEELLSASTSEARLSTLLASSLATAALLLALLGMYGLMSYWVARRRREIGVRMALGADQRSIFKLVVGRAMAIAALGLVVGTVLTGLATRAMQGLLFGIGSFHPPTLIFVTVALILVSFTASLLPTYRALKTSPTVSLRET